MDFACELMDLCRGTQEVEAVLSEGSDGSGSSDPLARLKMAMEYEEKKVGHSSVHYGIRRLYFVINNVKDFRSSQAMGLQLSVQPIFSVDRATQHEKRILGIIA